MRRYRHLSWIVGFAGLVSAAALAVSALPAGATIVCPKGVTPPSRYCTNVLPVAHTTAATNVTDDGATLRGVAGPNVTNGDLTHWFFEYGTSSCFSHLPVEYQPSCTVAPTRPGRVPKGPKSVPVSTVLDEVLQPATVYYFRLCAYNNDSDNHPICGKLKHFQTKRVHTHKHKHK